MRLASDDLREYYRDGLEETCKAVCMVIGLGGSSNRSRRGAELAEGRRRGRAVAKKDRILLTKLPSSWRSLCCHSFTNNAICTIR